MRTIKSVSLGWSSGHDPANLPLIRWFQSSLCDWLVHSVCEHQPDLGLWTSFDILLFLQKMNNPQLWYWRRKQANKTNVHHKPLAAKTITSKSIYTASNYFNDSINNHFLLARNTPPVLSVLLLFGWKKGENLLRPLLFKGRQTNERQAQTGSDVGFYHSCWKASSGEPVSWRAWISVLSPGRSISLGFFLSQWFGPFSKI